MPASTILGEGAHRYRVVEDWAKLPEGWEFKDAAAVAVDTRRPGSANRVRSLPCRGRPEAEAGTASGASADSGARAA